MNLVALLAAAAAVYTQAPHKGWFIFAEPGSYEAGIDRDGASLRSLKPQQQKFALLTQFFSAERFRGRRVRYAAWIRSDALSHWAGLFARVDGEEMVALDMDQMESRPIRGTTPWTRHEIVIDVAPEATEIVLAVQLAGLREIAVRKASFEIVPPETPKTSPGIHPVPRPADWQPWPADRFIARLLCLFASCERSKAPVNLDFSELN